MYTWKQLVNKERGAFKMLKFLKWDNQGSKRRENHAS